MLEEEIVYLKNEKKQPLTPDECLKHSGHACVGLTFSRLFYI